MRTIADLDQLPGNGDVGPSARAFQRSTSAQRVVTATVSAPVVRASDRGKVVPASAGRMEGRARGCCYPATAVIA